MTPHFLYAKSLMIVSGSASPRISCSMLIRHSMLSYSCPTELRRQVLNLRNLEKVCSPVQLETTRHKYMRKAISVFGKADSSLFSTKKIDLNSIHFPSLWSRLASCLYKMVFKRAANCTSSSAKVASTSWSSNTPVSWMLPPSRFRFHILMQNNCRGNIYNTMSLMPIEETGETRGRTDCLNFDLSQCIQIEKQLSIIGRSHWDYTFMGILALAAG